MSLTAKELYLYAFKFKKRKGKWPTLRNASRRFSCSMHKFESVAGDYEGPGYLGIVAGIRAGSGVSVLEIADRMIEAYGDSKLEDSLNTTGTDLSV